MLSDYALTEASSRGDRRGRRHRTRLRRYRRMVRRHQLRCLRRWAPFAVAGLALLVLVCSHALTRWVEGR